MEAQRQSGFTLIELAAIIVMLGILGAIAIPKFIDLSSDSHRASVATAAASLQSAVTMVNMKYRARRLTGAVDNLPGYGSNTVDVNTGGFPTDTAGQNTIGGNATRCSNVWSAILVQAPTVTTSATATGFDYRATAAGQVCTFTYRRNTSVTRTIVYNSTTGVVTSTNP
jgi:MSHA pilin protein MshB